MSKVTKDLSKVSNIIGELGLSIADAQQMQANIGAKFELQPTVMEMTQ